MAVGEHVDPKERNAEMEIQAEMEESDRDGGPAVESLVLLLSLPSLRSTICSAV